MKQILRLVIISLLLSSCQKIELTENANQPDFSNIFEIEAPEDFDYSTTKKIKFTIKAVNNHDEDMLNIPVKIYISNQNDYPEEGQEEVKGKLTGYGLITPDGSYQKEIIIDQNIENILIYTPYLGLPAYHRIQVLGNTNRDIFYTIGEDNTSAFTGTPNDHQWTSGLSGESVRNSDHYESDGNLSVSDRNISFTYMGGYNGQGIPDFLENPDDVVPQSVLNIVNSSLPEGFPVPVYNPQYITDGVDANTESLTAADVWVTFVHQGAGYQNALGYYTYNSNSPPSSPDDISNYQIIYPNVSYAGSGGGMNTGNKVYLGQFSAGTSIGYFLVPDGWDHNTQSVITDSGVNPNKHIKYSNKDFNTYTTLNNRSHNVLLNDPVNQLLLLGFEDITRPSGDKDFNDAIFYITATPFTAINTNNLAQSQSGGDRSVEVHLPDRPPTALADASLFGTKDDDSTPSLGRYYKTENNLPWGLHLLETFSYAVEKVQVTQAYSHFAEWAITGGNNFIDWYI